MPQHLITTLSVGEPFPQPDLVAQPSNGWHPNGSHTILLCLDNISPAEEAAFQGPLRFDLCPCNGLLVLLMTPQGCPEPQEMVWFLLQDDAANFAPPAHDGHALVTLIIVEQTTGIVAALRTFTWSPYFTTTVHRQLLKHQAQPMADPNQVHRTVAAMRAQYPHSNQLRSRSITHCSAED